MKAVAKSLGATWYSTQIRLKETFEIAKPTLLEVSTNHTINCLETMKEVTGSKYLLDPYSKYLLIPEAASTIAVFLYPLEKSRQIMIVMFLG